jgi:ubiquitin C-terminal hydrolase
MEQSFELAGETYAVINDLYQGLITSYVKCQECTYESNNQEKFLDIQLPIRNEFGTGVVNSSVEMAIENYLKPDLLEGDNQYACSQCNKKVDALKGLKLSKCPKVISLSLNRFTLDYNTF